MDFKKILLKKIGIYSGIAIILIVLIFAVKGDVSRRTVAIKEIRNKVASNSQLIGAYVVLQRDVDQAKEYEGQMAAYLINKDQLLNFSRDLGQMAQQNGFAFNFGFKDEVPAFGDNPRQTGIAFTVEGTVGEDKFISFLKTIENSQYFVSLSSLDITRDEKTLRANITGRVASF